MHLGETKNKEVFIQKIKGIKFPNRNEQISVTYEPDDGYAKIVNAWVYRSEKKVRFQVEDGDTRTFYDKKVEIGESGKRRFANELQALASEALKSAKLIDMELKQIHDRERYKR